MCFGSELRGYTIIIIIVIVDDNGVFSFVSLESFECAQRIEVSCGGENSSAILGLEY